MFDVLIIGGGVSGISCSLILGSAEKYGFCQQGKNRIFTHQKTSSLQEISIMPMGLHRSLGSVY
jgi:anaerobic glycerol-3-phosphate dehydrogenase